MKECMTERFLVEFVRDLNSTYPKGLAAASVILLSAAVFPGGQIEGLVKIPSLDSNVRLILGITAIPLLFFWLRLIGTLRSDLIRLWHRASVGPLILSIVALFVVLFSTLWASKPVPDARWLPRVTNSDDLSARRFDHLDEFKTHLDHKTAYGVFKERFSDLPISLEIENGEPPFAYLYITKNGGKIEFDLADHVHYRVDPRELLNVALGWIIYDDGTIYRGVTICLQSACKITTTGKHAAVFVYPLDTNSKSHLARGS